MTTTHTVFIWRDSIDPDQLHLGTGFYHNATKRFLYTWRSTLYADALLELFPNLSLDDYDRITSTPTEITLNLEFYED